MHYWDNKSGNAARAKQHTINMDKIYSQEIENCIKNTKFYLFHALDFNAFDSDKDGINNKEPIYKVIESKTVDTAFAEKNGRTCILNFASYRYPGGMFLEGSSAQEESLCHASYLYNILCKCGDYYKRNQEHLNNGLYQDAALYTPNVKFFLGSKADYFDVLTCAAPNYAYKRVSAKENKEALTSRIKFICDIFNAEKVDTAILGAWGCGVFGQDPAMVANLFKNTIETGGLKCRKVVFAIYGKENYDVFNKILKQKI